MEPDIVFVSGRRVVAVDVRSVAEPGDVFDRPIEATATTRPRTIPGPAVPAPQRRRSALVWS